MNDRVSGVSEFARDIRWQPEDARGASSKGRGGGECGVMMDGGEMLMIVGVLVFSFSYGFSMSSHALLGSCLRDGPDSATPLTTQADLARSTAIAAN